MSVTRTVVESMFDSARLAFAGSLITARYRATAFEGTKLPESAFEIVGDAGAQKNIEGGLRAKVSELPKPWPKMDEVIEIKSRETGNWENRLIVGTRVDEVGATMMITYAHQYDAKF